MNTAEVIDPAEARGCAARLSIVVITPMGRSGSNLVHTLFDGHPAVAVLPEVAQRYDHWSIFQEVGGRIADWIDRRPETYRSFNDDAVRRSLDRYFQANRSRYEQIFGQVSDALGGANALSERDFISALAMTWALVRGQTLGELRLICFHHHNHRRVRRDVPRLLDLYPASKLLATSRHPIESGYTSRVADARSGRASFRNFSRDLRGHSSESWRTLVRACRHLRPEAQLRIIDLNSLHADPDSILDGLCRWLGIADDPSLHRSTLAGFPWAGNSSDGRPIDTFAASRAVLRYPDAIGDAEGLTRDEYEFAEYLTRRVRRSVGYEDPVAGPHVGAAGYVVRLLRNIELVRSDVMDNDRGLRRMLRPLGIVEVGLSLREALLVALSRWPDLESLRLDRAASVRAVDFVDGEGR